MEGNNSHKIPSGCIWRYSICSLGSPPDESHHPVNDSEGSRFNPRRWQNAVWKSHITVMWKTWEERLQTQTTGTCAGGREPAAEPSPQQSIGNRDSRNYRAFHWETPDRSDEKRFGRGMQLRRAIPEAAEVVTVEVCSLLVTTARLKHRVLRVGRPRIRLLNFK